MFELKVSEKNLLSHFYLNDLVNTHHINTFTLTGDMLYLAESISGATLSNRSTPEVAADTELSKLVLFGEGLHLQQLNLVVQALDTYLEVVCYSVVKVDGMCGFAICAQVQVKQEQGIKTELEKLANQFMLELCLVNQTPKLSEPGLLLMDMDSTVIAVECIDEIAALAGVGEQVSQVTAQAMQGKLDFSASLRTRVACLQGADESILQQVRDALPLMPGVTRLVKLLKSYGWKVAIASGGFTYFADYLQERLNLDAAVANELDIVAGTLSGEVKGGIIDAQVKAHTLLELAEKWAIPTSQTIAMGDGANDLVMMDAAALGVGLHAKPVVREQADIAIRRGGLDSLLWVLAAS